MSYNSIAAMAYDGDLQSRMTACAAQQGIENPAQWVRDQIWHLVDSTDPNLADKYQFAVDNDKITPGKLEDVINDADILAVVQARKAALDAAAAAAQPPA